jgi:hypothetical protein
MVVVAENLPRRSGRAPRIQSNTPPTIEVLPDGQLAVVKDGRSIPTRLVKCFPWSEPTRFLSLRDEKNIELMLVTDVKILDEASRKALEGAVAEAGFVLEIERIDEVIEEYEIRNWKVTTRQGKRSFQTEKDEWPRNVPGGGLLIRDVAGDLFFVPRPAELDERSQKLLWALVD